MNGKYFWQYISTGYKSKPTNRIQLLKSESVLKHFKKLIFVRIMKQQYIFIVLLVLCLFTTVCLGDKDYYHLECGYPPSNKYREFANEIGKITIWYLHFF